MEKNGDIAKEWIKATTSEGKVYYFNKSTGESQWNEPEDSTTSTSNLKPRPPPKPKSVSKPPPRPKQVLRKPGPDSNDGAKQSELKSLMFSVEQANLRDPSKQAFVDGVDPDTGFGEWEEVVSEPVEVPGSANVLQEPVLIPHSSIVALHAEGGKVEFKPPMSNIRKKPRRIVEDD